MARPLSGCHSPNFTSKETNADELGDPSKATTAGREQRYELTPRLRGQSQGLWSVPAGLSREHWTREMTFLSGRGEEATPPGQSPAPDTLQGATGGRGLRPTHGVRPSQGPQRPLQDGAVPEVQLGLANTHTEPTCWERLHPGGRKWAPARISRSSSAPDYEQRQVRSSPEPPRSPRQTGTSLGPRVAGPAGRG